MRSKIHRDLQRKLKQGQISKFCRQVYAVVAKIPRGKTMSYRQVAEAIGRHGASRAVGNALNKNPFSPHVPCHRVIRSDGTLGGFAHGTKRKIELLVREGFKF